MHAVACRSLRLTSRISARVIAGRRHPQSLRSFHCSSVTFRASDPSIPTDSPKPLDAGDAADEGTNVKAETSESDGPAPPQDAENTEETPSALLERLRNGRKKINNPDKGAPYGSAMRRSQRNRESKEAPAITIPEWFLKRNVKLPEHAVGSANHIIQTTHGDPFSRTQLEQEGPIGTESGVDNARSKSYHIDKAMMQEIVAAVVVGLDTAKPELSTSFPATKSNIILHCPLDGGVYFLDKVVEDAASIAGADIMILEAQDLAELGGEFIREEPEELSGRGVRSLGYNSYHVANCKNADDIDEDDPAEEDDADDDNEPLTRIARVHARLTALQSRIADFRIRRPLRNFIPGTHGASVDDPWLHRSGSMSRPQDKEDFRMNALLEALLETAQLKRARATVAAASDTSNANSSNEISMALHGQAIDVERNKLVILIRDFGELNSHKEGGKILDQLLHIVQRRRNEGQQVMMVGTTSSVNLTPEHTKAGIQEMQLRSDGTSFRTIFVVPSDVPGGTSELFESDRKHRTRELNVRLCQDMVRQLDPTETNFVEADDLGQRIAECLASGDPTSTTVFAQEEDLTEEVAEEIAEEDQVPNDDSASSSSDLRRRWLARLERSVMPFNVVHRLVTTALGLKLQAKEVLGIDHIISAMCIIHSSNDAKYRFASSRSASSSEADVDSESLLSTTSSHRFKHEDRIKRLRRTATHHEKKLLSGVIKADAITTKFTDVHAPPETVEALKTLTSLNLIRPDAFKYGVLATDKIPGLLLYGPPGTGKTLLAKAVAKESGATMLEVSGSEVYDMYVGEGEKNVKAIFSLAKKLTPCVVFIDEADAIFGSRGGGPGQRTSHRELINQFLREWDGMSEMGAFIMVATNRPFDLDDAVLRRLPRRLLVDLPVEKDRESILKIHLKDEQLDPEVKLPDLASQTPLYSGSDLKNLAVAAALACVREENDEAAKHRASAPSTSTTDYVYPEKRTLKKRHFDRAMEEISASISEDMSSLGAIKKFDEKYGDRRGRRKRLGYGFGVGGQDQAVVESDARVRV